MLSAPATSPNLNSDQVTPFQFEDHAVRVQVDEFNQPWFNANDICAALELSNGRKAIADHVDPEDVTKRDTLTAGGIQSQNHVNESGMYALVFGSAKESAKRFKKWVTAEVLPAIRKTGAYTAVTDPRTAALIESLVRLDTLEQAQKRQEAETRRLQEHVQHLEDRIDTDTRYFTIVGWHNLRKASICKADAIIAGRRASAMSRQRGVTIGKVFDAQHGEINAYHRDILTEIFGAIQQTTALQAV